MNPPISLGTRIRTGGVWGGVLTNPTKGFEGSEVDHDGHEEKGPGAAAIFGLREENRRERV